MAELAVFQRRSELHEVVVSRQYTDSAGRIHTLHNAQGKTAWSAIFHTGYVVVDNKGS